MSDKHGYNRNAEAGEMFVGRVVNKRRITLFDMYAEYIALQRLGKCKVYWGRHACNNDSGHLNEQHKCICGCTPEYYSVLWGEDLTEKDKADNPIHLKALEKVERLFAWHDDFDKWGNYRPDKRGANAA